MTRTPKTFSIEDTTTYGGKKRWRAVTSLGQFGPWRKNHDSADADGRRACTGHLGDFHR